MRAVIVNPASARGKTAQRWRSIVAQLADERGLPEVLLTRGVGDGVHVTRQLVADGVKSLVVLGGDGTIGEVMSGLLQPADSECGVHTAPGIDLAVIHQGTGGDLVRGLGIPTDTAAAAHVALHGTRRAIDVGVVNMRGDGAGAVTRAFASTANVGISADVVRIAEGAARRLGSSGAFAFSTVAALARNRRRTVQLAWSEHDLDERDIVDVIVANNRYMGGGMLAAPNAQIDDGMFDVVVIDRARRTRLLRVFPRIYSGTHINDPLVTVRRTAHVGIDVASRGEPLDVVVDGELAGTTPAAFSVLRHAVTVRVPG